MEDTSIFHLYFKGRLANVFEGRKWNDAYSKKLCDTYVLWTKYRILFDESTYRFINDSLKLQVVVCRH